MTMIPRKTTMLQTMLLQIADEMDNKAQQAPCSEASIIRAAADEIGRLTVYDGPKPWELPIGTTGHKDREHGLYSYDRQEQRVAMFLAGLNIGAGDDPVGFLLASFAAKSKVVP